ncbi:hypothetical protein WA026_018120 [Henosepilachna vigintioctopunctata]|uniref:Uncharacterized protein n=1 Tax=Henosepilachna vigintioctopunctata TaxID=420089 RepID=A0AAW1UQ06_9CUCU
MCWEKLVIILFALSEKSLVYGGKQERIDQQTKKFHSKVEYLVKKWSPLIYLAPGELFKPLSVEDFIKHVYAANAEGFRFNKKVSYNQNVYLKTLEDIETLTENEQSFLHGRDSQNVDAYALVTYCNKKNLDVNSTHLSNPEFFVSYWFFFPYNLGKKICFLAWGSHGFWSEPGNHTYFTVPKLQDQTGFGDMWRTWQNLNIYHLNYESLPKWISFRGKWGNPRSDCILFRNLGLCKQADGPLGPRSTDFDCNSL